MCWKKFCVNYTPLTPALSPQAGRGRKRAARATTPDDGARNSTTVPAFVDTNVAVYALGRDSNKRARVGERGWTSRPAHYLRRVWWIALRSHYPSSGPAQVSASQEDQKTRGIIGHQVRQIIGMHPYQLLDGFGGAIAPFDPYYLGWRTREHAALVEIGILRHDDEAIGAGVVPNGTVVGPVQSDIQDVRRFGKNVRQPAREKWREVLVEQQLHA